MAEQIETYDQLDAALAGEVVVDIGQIGPLTRKVLDQAVRAGRLVKWRGKWYPHAGAPYGIGPDKSCWSTPEVASHFTEIKRGVREHFHECGGVDGHAGDGDGARRPCHESEGGSHSAPSQVDLLVAGNQSGPHSATA